MNRPREDWPRLASYVISARIAAGFRDRRALSAATGITDRTLGKLETGHRVSPDTLAAIEQAVGWKPDSARQVLAGGEPSPVPREDAAGDLAGMIRQGRAVTGLTEDEVRIVNDFVDMIRRSASQQAERRRGA